MIDQNVFLGPSFPSSLNIYVISFQMLDVLWFIQWL